MEQSKKQNWFRRHWIISIILIILILGAIGSLSEEKENKTTTKKTGLILVDEDNSNNEELKDMSISEKKKLCIELCAGEEIDVPVVKNECSSSCEQTYYYSGEEDLDKYILELKNEY